jgi:hypothetical protein
MDLTAQMDRPTAEGVVNTYHRKHPTVTGLAHDCRTEIS